MFEILITVCMLTYGGEVCEPRKIERTYESQEKCEFVGKFILKEMAVDPLLRIKAMYCVPVEPALPEQKS